VFYNFCVRSFLGGFVEKIHGQSSGIAALAKAFWQ
jgi:hypothetical protein